MSTGIETSDIAPFRFRRMSRPGLLHGVTARRADLPASGNVSFLVGHPDHQAIVDNRRRWADAIGIDARRLVCARQVHGNRVARVTGSDAGRGGLGPDDAVWGYDGLITDEWDLPLMVLSADCVPILYYDPVRRVIGAAHAGWRGTVLDVAGAVVRAMVDAFDSRPADLVVGLGPSIGPCCYEVGPEVLGAWRSSGLDPKCAAIIEDDDREVFDLWRANEIALIAAGVLPERIEHARICTRCASEHYFSRRADNGVRGLFGAVICLSDPSLSARDEVEP